MENMARREMIFALDGCNFSWDKEEVAHVKQAAASFYPNLQPNSACVELETHFLNTHRRNNEQVTQLDVYLLILHLANEGEFL